jgi:excinuclease UvrABC helicase subunit UvrB
LRSQPEFLFRLCLARPAVDLIEEARKRVERKERVLVTTLTRRTAEELTDSLRDIGINVRYLYSGMDAIARGPHRLIWIAHAPA